MSRVVFLKGVNVAGHRTLRPKTLADQLADLDVVNVGAAGTLVVRKRVSPAALRAEITRRVPFPVEMMICSGRALLRVASSDVFDRHEARPDIVQFVGVMAERRSPPAGFPMALPDEADWRLRVLEYQDRFVLGLHRREMKALRYLGELEKALGTSVTIRTWGTILRTANVLDSRGS